VVEKTSFVLKKENKAGMKGSGESWIQDERNSFGFLTFNESSTLLPEPVEGLRNRMINSVP
jgi:hypothetical protein